MKKMDEIRLTDKFEPLFALLDPNNHTEVDTVVITGGRYSLKSYTASIFSLVALVDYGWNILYTRYTNSSIVDSVKPEVSDKIDLLRFGSRVRDTETHIECGNHRISFKGIKTGSKSQTANLKSLSGFNCFINDEAEEIPDYKTFKKVFYSIRSATCRNLTILILNPTDEEHWIFKEFFEKKGLRGGENCQVDNVLYIHSSYLDADMSQIPKNILTDYERLRLTDIDSYENIVLGGWLKQLEGVVFEKSSIKRYREFPESILDEKGVEINQYFQLGFADTADEGTDNFSMPIGRVYPSLGRVYIHDAIFDQNNLTIQEGQVVGKIKEHGMRNLVIESNNAGAYFIRRIREIEPDCEVFGQYAKANKMSRILSYSGIIKLHFYFPENPNPTLQKFMNQVFRLLKTSKDQDDAPDSLSGMAAYLEKFYELFTTL